MELSGASHSANDHAFWTVWRTAELSHSNQQRVHGKRIYSWNLNQKIVNATKAASSSVQFGRKMRSDRCSRYTTIVHIGREVGIRKYGHRGGRPQNLYPAMFGEKVDRIDSGAAGCVEHQTSQTFDAEIKFVTPAKAS